jgi:hypothetical protein
MTISTESSTRLRERSKALYPQGITPPLTPPRKGEGDNPECESGSARGSGQS